MAGLVLLSKLNGTSPGKLSGPNFGHPLRRTGVLPDLHNPRKVNLFPKFPEGPLLNFGVPSLSDGESIPRSGSWAAESRTGDYFMVPVLGEGGLHKTLWFLVWLTWLCGCCSGAKLWISAAVKPASQTLVPLPWMCVLRARALLHTASRV